MVVGLGMSGPEADGEVLGSAKAANVFDIECVTSSVIGFQEE